MSNDHDPLLDACLDEILGGITPPDLSQRILHALAARSGTVQVTANVNSNFLEPEAPPIQGVRLPEAALHRSRLRSRRTKGRRTWPGIVIVALVCVVIASGGYWARDRAAQRSGPIVTKQPERVRPNGRSNSQLANDRESSVRRGPIDADRPLNELEPTREGFGSTLPDPLAQNAESEAATGSDPNRPLLVASSEHEIIRAVNELVEKSWTENHVTAGERATEEEWCRRIYLRILGRIPSVRELERFVAHTAGDKRGALLDELLGRPDTAEEYAQHWAAFWVNVLIGRSSRDPSASREDLLIYLRDAIRQNVSYDEMARQLITATGSNERGADDYNGAINFLLANQSDRETLVTAKTCQIFLGVQLQCVQCHNHPTNQLVQDQFWQMNSFFRQMAVEKNPQSQLVRVTNRDFPGEGRGDATEAEVYFEKPNGQVKATYPAFLDGTELPRSGLLSDVDRRQLLAARVIQSPEFGRMMVNRIWGHFLGHGFTKPIDDIGAHNRPSHEELLDRLASEFVAHRYDSRQLIRWIALSEPFALSSKVTPANAKDAPELGVVPLFSHYYTRQMQVEELVQSLEMLANGPASERPSASQQLARMSAFGEFSKNMGTDDGAEENTFTGGFPQYLFLMNGELTRKAMSAERGSMLDLIASSRMPVEQKIVHLFEAALSRKPTPREAQAVRTLINKNSGQEPTALQDLWWALLNSNEFILDH